MKIPSHPIPASAETLLRAMRVALTIAAERERAPNPNFADAFGSIACLALESAIDVDAGATC